MSLHKLSAATITRIKAQQVITGMVAAVKELLENALDAGATQIQVKMDGDGLAMIQVKDNGSGIPADATDECAVGYCTSKIIDFESLSKLTSYGFRGEALHSLCAEGEVEITTRTANDADERTTYYQSDGSARIDPNNAPIVKQSVLIGKTGTSVTVKNIFARTPVRLERMKKDKLKECKNILNLMYAYMLAHPRTSFSLSIKGHIEIQKLKAKKGVHNNTYEVIQELYGPMLATGLVQIETVNEDKSIKITGLLPKTDAEYKIVTRATNDRMFIYVNNRPIDFPAVIKIVNLFVRKWFGVVKRYPFAVLNIELKPDTYDVNVTPDKKKLFFHNEQNLVQFIHNVLKSLYPVNDIDTIFAIKPAIPNDNEEEEKEKEDANKSMDAGDDDFADDKHSKQNTKNNNNNNNNKNASPSDDSSISSLPTEYRRSAPLVAPSPPSSPPPPSAAPPSPPPTYATPATSATPSTPAATASSPPPTYATPSTNATASSKPTSSTSKSTSSSPPAPKSTSSTSSHSSSSHSSSSSQQGDKRKSDGTQSSPSSSQATKKQKAQQNAFDISAFVDIVAITECAPALAQTEVFSSDPKTKYSFYKDPVTNSNSQKTHTHFWDPEKEHVINPPKVCGQTTSNGKALFCIEFARRLFVFNPFKANEMLCYENLLKEKVIPRQVMDPPVVMTKDLFEGDEDMWRIVRAKSPTIIRAFHLNGFELHPNYDPVAKEDTVELKAIPKNIEGIGAEDMVELVKNLVKVVDKDNLSVPPHVNVRPERIANYLIGEANRTTTDDMAELTLTKAQELLDKLVANHKEVHSKTQPDSPLICCECPHGKSIFEFISAIPNIE